MKSITEATVFGPVSSRRLGRSLGVDIIPYKVCTLNCVYCEVGRTDKRGCARREYISVATIVRELDAALSAHQDIDCVTYSGSGEPTLHSRLRELIRATHDLTDLPVAVLTNGTLLWRREIRADLEKADIVCPSLNAVSEDVFQRINRPHPSLSASLVLDGLIAFRSTFKGKYFLEILFVDGLNDSDKEIELLRNACDRIRPDRIHLNTVVRPPSESWARPVPIERLNRIKDVLGPTAEVLAGHGRTSLSSDRVCRDTDILALLERRAMTFEEIMTCLSSDSPIVQQHLRSLVAGGALHMLEHNGEEYYAVSRAAQIA